MKNFKKDINIYIKLILTWKHLNVIAYENPSEYYVALAIESENVQRETAKAT